MRKWNRRLLAIGIFLLPVESLADMPPPQVSMPSTPMPGVGRALSDMFGPQREGPSANPRLVREEATVHVYPELVHVQVEWELEATAALPTKFRMGLPDANPGFFGPPIEAHVVRVDAAPIETSWRGGWFNPAGPYEVVPGGGPNTWWRSWREVSWYTWPLELNEGERITVEAEYIRLLHYYWYDDGRPAVASVGYDWTAGLSWSGDVEHREVVLVPHGTAVRRTSPFRRAGEAITLSPTEFGDPDDLRWLNPVEPVAAQVTQEVPLASPLADGSEPPAVTLMRRSVHALAVQPDLDELGRLIEVLHEGLESDDPLHRRAARRVLEALDGRLRACAIWLDEEDPELWTSCVPLWSRAEPIDLEYEPPPSDHEPSPSDEDGGEFDALAEQLERARAIVWRERQREPWAPMPACGRPSNEDGRDVMLDPACQATSHVGAHVWQILVLGDREAGLSQDEVAGALLALEVRQRRRAWWRWGLLGLGIVGVAVVSVLVVRRRRRA